MFIGFIWFVLLFDFWLTIFDNWMTRLKFHFRVQSSDKNLTYFLLLLVVNFYMIWVNVVAEWIPLKSSQILIGWQNCLQIYMMCRYITWVFQVGYFYKPYSFIASFLHKQTFLKHFSWRLYKYTQVYISKNLIFNSVSLLQVRMTQDLGFWTKTLLLGRMQTLHWRTLVSTWDQWQGILFTNGARRRS